MAALDCQYGTLGVNDDAGIVLGRPLGLIPNVGDSVGARLGPRKRWCLDSRTVAARQDFALVGTLLVKIKGVELDARC